MLSFQVSSCLICWLECCYFINSHKFQVPPGSIDTFQYSFFPAAIYPGMEQSTCWCRLVSLHWDVQGSIDGHNTRIAVAAQLAPVFVSLDSVTSPVPSKPALMHSNCVRQYSFVRFCAVSDDDDDDDDDFGAERGTRPVTNIQLSSRKS